MTDLTYIMSNKCLLLLCETVYAYLGIGQSIVTACVSLCTGAYSIGIQNVPLGLLIGICLTLKVALT